MDIQINPAHLSLIVLILNGVGAAVKKLPAIENHWIPFILWGTGAASHCAFTGWTAQNAAIGVGAAMLANGAHQTVQVTKSILASGKHDDTIPPQ